MRFIRAKTPIQYWIEHDQKQQQLAQQQIEEAYAALKAELIEQARIRKQQALEKSLAEKRAEQARYHAALYADEVQQFKQQSVVLAELQAQIDSEVEQLAARYHKIQMSVWITHVLAVFPTVKLSPSLKAYVCASNLRQIRALKKPLPSFAAS